MLRNVSEEEIRVAVLRLKELDGQIRKFFREYVHCNMAGGYWGTFSNPIRSLTEPEWEEIKLLVEEYEFPCRLGMTPYSFSLCICSHGEIEGENTETILYIECGQLPIKEARNGFSGQMAVLKQLSLLTHRPRNVEILEWYGFEPPRDLSYYVY